MFWWGEPLPLHCPPPWTSPAPPELSVPSLQPPACSKAAFCLYACPPAHPGPTPTLGQRLWVLLLRFGTRSLHPQHLQGLGHCRHVTLGGVNPLWNVFMMLVSDSTIKHASNQGAANTVPFPHFPRSEGECFPCSHSQIQKSHLWPCLRSICQKLQDPSMENRLLKSNTFSSASETSPKRAVADF